jgi:hypothetical protein
MSALQLLNQRPVSQIDVYGSLRYDYNRISDESVRERVRQAAVQIKPRLKRAAEDLFVIGQELVAVKEELPHGEWGDWLATEFSLSDRMARNFMNVAIRLGSKTEKFSVLPVSALYELAAPSTVPEVIEQVEEKLETGSVPSMLEIRTWKQRQRQQRLATLTTALDEWVKAQETTQDDQIRLLKSLQAEECEPPAQLTEVVADLTAKEVRQAVEQLLAQHQPISERTASPPISTSVDATGDLQTTLQRALALLNDVQQQVVYAQLTGDDPHLAQAIEALHLALQRLDSVQKPTA